MADFLKDIIIDGQLQTNERIYTLGGIRITGGIYDQNNSIGTAGQLLTSDGTNVEWVNTSQILGTQSNVTYYDVKNTTGATISKGKVVMAVGTDGNSGHILIDEMVADGSVEPRYILGVLNEDIAHGTTGQAIYLGQIKQLNTTGQNGETWSDGTVLWCDPNSPGDLTQTEPNGPNLKIPVAIVLNAATNGKIQVRATYNEGIHDLHDTKIVNQVDGDILVWDNTTGVWFNDSTLNVDQGVGVDITGNLDVSGTGTFNLSSNGTYFIGGTNSLRQLSITSGDNISSHALHTFNISSSNGKYEFQVNGSNVLDLDSTIVNITGDLDVSGQAYLGSSSFTGQHVIRSSSDGPLIVRSNDATTGIRFVDPDGSNYIFYSGSSDTYNFSGSDVTNVGSIGIGTTDPTVNLDIENSTGVTIDINSSSGDGKLRFQDGGVNKWHVGRDNTNQNFAFSSGSGLGNGDVLTLTTAGNVGIGTTSPSSKLTVEGKVIVDHVIGSLTTGSVQEWNSYSGVSGNTKLDLKIGRGNSNKVAIFQATYEGGGYSDIILQDQGGNVGIGTTSPSTKFHVVGAAVDNESLGLFTNNYSGGGVFYPGLKVVNTSSNHSYGTVAEFRTEAVSGTDRPSILFTNAHSNHNWTVGQGGYAATDNFSISYRNFHPNTAGGWGTPRFVIDTAGNVGIGTTSPVKPLHIYSSNDAPLRVESSDATTGILFADSTSNNALYYVGSGDYFYTTAKLGIGTSSPAAKLDVNGDLNVTGTGTFSGLLTANAGLISTTGDFTNRVTVDATSGSSYGLEVVGTSGGARQIFIAGQAGFSNGFTVDYDGTNMQYVFRNGNVGIGTTSPSQKLHVSGNVRITGAYYDSNNSAGTSGQVLSSTATGTSWVSGSGLPGGPYLPLAGGTMTGTSGVIFPDNFKLNIGTSSDLQIYHNGSSSYIDQTGVGKLLLNTLNTGINIQAGSGETRFTKGGINSEIKVDDASQVNKVVLKASGNSYLNGGNVGIGTTSPNTTLDVNGSGNFTGALQVSSVQGINSTGWVHLHRYANSLNVAVGNNGTNVNLIVPNGSVGVGTGSPSAKLHLYTGGLGTNTGVTDMLRIELNRSDHGDTPSGPAILFKDQDSNNNTNEARIKMMTVNDTDYGDNDEAASNLLFETTNNGTASDKMIITGRGNVGIGTTNPNYLLDVEKSGANVRIYDTTGNTTLNLSSGNTANNNIEFGDPEDPNAGQIVYRHASDSMSFTTNASEAVRIDSDGKVGIGTTLPNAPLDVASVNGTTSGIQQWSYISAPSSYRLQLNQIVSTGVVKYSFDQLNAGASYNNVIVLDRGNVGIGTTTPEGRFEVQTIDSNRYIRFKAPNGEQRFQFYTGGTGNAAAQFMYDSDGTTRNVQISAGGTSYFNAGNVGIGTTNPISKLHIYGGNSAITPYQSGQNGLIVENSGRAMISLLGSNDEYIMFSTPTKSNAAWIGYTIATDLLNIKSDEDISLSSSSGEKVRIKSTGNVGIGTTSPDAKLDVSGAIKSSHAVYNDINGTRLINPGGGSSNSLGNSNTVGAIKIALPQSWTSTMMRMTIKVYEYSESKSFTINCGGYNYGSSSSWRNEFAYIESQSEVDRNFTVRFGYDSNNKCCIYIGELDSVWQYPKVFVTDFQAGFNNTEGNKWDDGWSVSMETTAFENVSQTRTNCQVNNWKRNGSDLYYGSVSGNVGIGTTSPSDGDLNINDPKLHVQGPTTSGSYHLVSRFQAGNDADNTGAAIAINHSNDRGLLIRAGRKDSDRPVAFYDLIDSNGSYTNMLEIGEYASVGFKSIFKTNVDITGDLDVSGNIKLTETAATVDTDKFAVLDSGVLKYRTGAEVLSDIGAAPSSHTHSQYLLNNAFDEGVGLYLTAGSYNAGTDTATTPLVIDEGDFIYTKDGSYLRRLIGKTTGDEIQIGQSGTSLIDTINFLPGTGGNSAVKVNGNTVWNAGNDGSGSGLDADLLDGKQPPTNFAATSQTYTTIASGGWALPTGSSIFSKSDSVGGVSDDGYWFVTGRRDVGGGYSGIYTSHSDGNAWIGYSLTSSANPIWYKLWTAGNDGSGSGLDADLLDGQHASAFAASSHTHTWADISGETANSVNSWGGLRHQTNDGYIDFGPANSNHAHIYTDRSNFYFNKQIQLNGGSQINQNDIRAKVFYDSDNTSYYLDPASISNLNAVTATRIGVNPSGSSTSKYGISLYSGYSSGEPTYGLMFTGTAGSGTHGAVTSDWATYFTMNNSNSRGWIFRKAGSANSASISAGGVATFDTSVNSPIFYDSNNTGYYGDFAGNSRYNTAQGNYLGLGVAANTSGSYRLNMGGSVDMNANSIDYVSQLHFNDNVRFYDDGNDSYLNFKYGDVNAGGIRFRRGDGTQKGYLYADNSGFGLLDSDGAWAVRTQTGTDPLELRCNGELQFRVYDSYTYSFGSSRAQLFYDSNDTNYYLDPGNTGISAKLAGKVGIGETNPEAKLDVSGHVNASDGYSTNNTSRKYFWRTDNTFNSGTIWKKIGTYNSSGQSSRIMITITGTVSYGGGTKPGKTTILAQVNNNNLLEGTFWTEGMSSQYGNVGFISNSATSHDIYYQVGSYAEYAYEAIISDGTFTVDSTTVSTPTFTRTATREWNVNQNLIVNSSGWVGIGLTSPRAKFHAANGTLTTWTPTSGTTGIFESTASSRSFVQIVSANEGELWFSDAAAQGRGRIRYQHTDDSLRVWVNGSEKMSIGSGGSATFTGSVTATNFILSSDERVKENIENLTPNKLNVNWKTFNMKSENEDNGKRYGVIAQELEEEHPEFVHTDDEGFKSVKYIDLLVAKIAELEARLEKLEK